MPWGVPSTQCCGELGCPTVDMCHPSLDSHACCSLWELVVSLVLCLLSISVCALSDSSLHIWNRDAMSSIPGKVIRLALVCALICMILSGDALVVMGRMSGMCTRMHSQSSCTAVLLYSMLVQCAHCWGVGDCSHFYSRTIIGHACIVCCRGVGEFTLLRRSWRQAMWA